MNYKTAILGPADTISLFKATGAETFPVTTSDEALDILKELRKSTIANEPDKTYAVILIIEDLLKDIRQEELTKFTESPLPSLLALPGIRGSSGISSQKLKQLAERAVGINILG